MGFHQALLEATRADQAELLQIPFVRAAMAGDLDREAYRRFLGQAYHHVRHTVPLLMATGARLDARRDWLRRAMADYIREELGHEDWILQDIAACGGDPDQIRRSRPDLPCELMVAYAYDQVQRRDPLGFLGMVHVLEGTSVRGATQAAHALQDALGLPADAFTYLSTHGDLDQEHTAFFGGLADRLERPEEQDCVLHAAHVFFRLYGDIFRSLPLRAAAGSLQEN
jgi:pyrroloquinoline quinone (PQQ) biosynthesis protein C